MCGITVLMHRDGSPVNAQALSSMTDALSHRGPDGAGLHVSGPVGMGHRRLSIIDLAGGHQPLCNEDGTVWITFNGEIYNYRQLRQELISKGHRFRTDSDTETIVHAYEQWGTDCLTRLRGMFAFAIWDEKSRELLLARDRFGIKPLLYWETPDLFAVASEMQGFQSHQAFQGTIDPAAIDMYLQYQYIPAPHSIFREVRKLPPAHFLILRPDEAAPQPKRYWNIEFHPDHRLTEAEWVERLDAALEETISAHLISDVPFGAFLSGGLDSSTVVAYMRRALRSQVETFTIGHSSPDYDETAWANEASRVCGANHHVDVVQPDSMELLPKLVRHFGEPFADSSAIATYHASRLARQHVKMVLSGDGGDELFAGYYNYPAILWQAEPRVSPLRRGRNWIADQARKLGLWPARPGAADDKYARIAVLSDEVRHSLWRPEFASLKSQTRREFDHDFAPRSRECLLNRLQRYDIENYIAYDNLPKVDTVSMCHGLEVRVPLLDHVFLQTVSQIPPELKLFPISRPKTPRGRLVPGEEVVGKYLLKKAAGRFFSSEFLHRPKRGFEVPVQDWFTGTHKNEFNERLTGADSPLLDYFQHAGLTQLVNDAGQSRVNAWRGWSLLVLEEWLQQANAAATRNRTCKSASTMTVEARLSRDESTRFVKDMV
jgi:asparagine synthase (glutamine-hydrolysing)